MIEEGKWYRVVERLSPLCGCDVRVEVTGKYDWPLIVALRRVDVFAGDRPYQLVAAEGENLGIAVDPDDLELAPIQDDIVELTTRSPYGECLEESELIREGSNLVLRCAFYERASQISLEAQGTGVLASRTFLAEDHGERVAELADLFADVSVEADDVVAAINAGGD